MGEAKRRKNHLSLEARRANLDRIREEGDGVYLMEIYAPENVLAARGIGFATAAIDFAADIVKLGYIDCFICDDYKVGPKDEEIAALVYIMPKENPNKIGSLSAICPHCARQPNLNELALNRIRDSFLPNARYIQISDQVGRA